MAPEKNDTINIIHILVIAKFDQGSVNKGNRNTIKDDKDLKYTKS